VDTKLFCRNDRKRATEEVIRKYVQDQLIELDRKEIIRLTGLVLKLGRLRPRYLSPYLFNITSEFSRTSHTLLKESKRCQKNNFQNCLNHLILVSLH
jgi:hypothetical protein